MFEVCKKIVSMYASTTAQEIPKMCIYEERIACFKKLSELQEKMKTTDKEYATSMSSANTNQYENLKTDLEKYNNQYKKEYELCEKIMKY